MPKRQQQKKKRKIKVTITEGGETKEVEMEVEADSSVAWEAPSQTRYLGHAIPRVDGPAKVSGAAQYTHDVVLPGMLYGKFLRSPHAHARVVRIDAERARALPGVKAVLTDFGTTIRYAGQEVAAVAAVSEEIAEDALRLIEVEYEVLPHAVTIEQARKAQPVSGSEPNVRPAGQREQGDVEAAFKQAAALIEADYHVQVRTHCCLETHGAVAKWDDEEHLTVWISTQGIFSVQDDLANAFGLKRENVRVLCEYMGGGFGSKFDARIEGITAARLAKMTGAPVKMILSRYEEQIATGNGPDAHARVKAAASRDGKVVAMEIDCWGTPGADGGWGIPMPYIYRVPNYRVRQEAVVTNTGYSCAMRAPGHPQACFIMESAMDELAYQIGLDPLEFRRRNDPNPVRQKEYEIGAQLIGWDRRNPKPGAETGRFKRGMGLAATTWGGGGGGGSRPVVQISPRGEVRVLLGTQDIGTGTRTYVAAIVAEELGIPLERVEARIGDTRYGYSGASGGSTTTASVAPAVKMAAVEAKTQLLAAVASSWKVPIETLKAENGHIFLQDNPNKRLRFEQACRLLGKEGLSVHGEWNPHLQASGVAGCQFAEVEVDTWTGKVRVLKVVAIQDCGYVLNRLAVESQIIGGVIQGLAFALLENRMMDENTGRMLNPNLEGYKLPAILEIPEIIPVIYDNPTGRISGMGEPPVIPTAAAIANAVYHATGVRVRHLPITPARMLAAMQVE